MHRLLAYRAELEGNEQLRVHLRRVGVALQPEDLQPEDLRPEEKR
jgi:hypothetical protein